MSRSSRLNGRVGLADLISPTTFDALDASKAAVLRPFHARLAKRNAVPVDWMTIGDSTTEGARQTNAQARWENKVLSTLRSRLGQTAAGGFGYVPCYYSTGDQQAPSPSQFVSAGTNVVQPRGNYGLGRRSMVLGGSGPGGPDKAVLTLPSSGPYASTSVDVIYAVTANATSTLDIYLDGALQASINTVVPSNSVRAGDRYRISGLAGGAHTIEARATGGLVYFEGWMLYNGDEASGLRLWEAAASGSNTQWHALQNPAAKLTPNFVYSYDDLVKVNPQLVTIMLGLNDYYNSGQTQTPEQYGVNLTSIIANVRAACTVAPAIVLMVPWERGSVPGGIRPWREYVAQLYAVAAADGGVAVFDAGRRFPPGPATIAYDLINGDTIHINDNGGTFLADAFANWILPR